MLDARLLNLENRNSVTLLVFKQSTVIIYFLTRELKANLDHKCKINQNDFLMHGGRRRWRGIWISVGKKWLGASAKICFLFLYYSSPLTGKSWLVISEYISLSVSQQTASQRYDSSRVARKEEGQLKKEADGEMRRERTQSCRDMSHVQSGLQRLHCYHNN